MSGTFHANPKFSPHGWRPMTLNEALLAVFTVGLLLGLWLGGVTGKRGVRDLRNLEQRIESLELQRTLFESPFVTQPDHVPQSVSPETDADSDPLSVTAVRV